MSVVLNEYEWAENMISEHSLGKKPLETLSRVSRYYYENRYNKREIRKMLDTFLTQCDPTANLSGWSDALDKIAKNAGKTPLVKLTGVSISKTEMHKITEVRSVQARRLAFTLLCLAKYWDATSSNNNHWVNTPDNEIMQMANIRTSVKRQSEMFGQLKEAGLIKFAKKIDNLNVQVLFVDNGEEEMFVSDFRNIGYQYMRHYGGPFFECVNCGITIRGKTEAKGRPQKYCPACAAEIRTQQNVNAVMRRRKLFKS